MESLLREDVLQLATMWAIPHQSWVNKSRAFDGDHMFHGLWVGDGTLAQSGTRVAIKAFCGATEIKEYETETKLLTAIMKVPHTQRLIVARRQSCAAKADDDVAAVVSLLQAGTSKSIRRLEDLRTMGRRMLEALMGLHNIGIIHRDIKPSNILWDSWRREATLIDFGLATEGTFERLSTSDTRKFSEGSSTSTVLTSDGIVGIDGYQAPELLAGNRYTSEIDVYSLGVTLSNLARDARIDGLETLTEAVRETLYRLDGHTTGLFLPLNTRTRSVFSAIRRTLTAHSRCAKTTRDASAQSRCTTEKMSSMLVALVVDHHAWSFITPSLWTRQRRRTTTTCQSRQKWWWSCRLRLKLT
jgi:hypothetical protein